MDPFAVEPYSITIYPGTAWPWGAWFANFGQTNYQGWRMDNVFTFEVGGSQFELLGREAKWITDLCGWNPMNSALFVRERGPERWANPEYTLSIASALGLSPNLPQYDPNVNPERMLPWPAEAPQNPVTGEMVARDIVCGGLSSETSEVRVTPVVIWLMLAAGFAWAGRKGRFV